MEQAFDIRLELRQVLNQLGEGRLLSQRTREAETLAERLDDDHRRCRVWAFLTTVHVQVGELDEALQKRTRALDLAEQLGDPALRIPAPNCLAQVCYYRAEYDRVANLISDTFAAFPTHLMHEDFGQPVPSSGLARAWLVTSLAELGRFAEAGPHAAEAIRLAEAIRHGVTLGMAYRAAGLLHLFKGEATQARALFERSVAITRPGGTLGIGVAFSAWALAQLGETAEASARIQEGVGLLDRQMAAGSIIPTGQSFHALGRACLLLDRLAEARRVADRALEVSSHYPGWAAHAQHLLGDISIHPECFDATSGEAHYRPALAVAERHHMRPLVAHCHLGLGKLYRRTDKHEQAQEHLATATTMYREMGMTYWLEKAEAEVRELG